MKDDKDKKGNDNVSPQGLMANIVTSVTGLDSKFQSLMSSESKDEKRKDSPSVQDSKNKEQKIESNGSNKGEDRDKNRPSRAAQYKQSAEQVVVVEGKKEKVLKDLPNILSKAAKQGNENEIIDVLKKNPFLKDHEYEKGHSIMHPMILAGNWSGIEIMLDMGVKFTARDVKALSLAASNDGISGNIQYKAQVLQKMMKQPDGYQALQDGLSAQIQEYFQDDTSRTRESFTHMFAVVEQVLSENRNISLEITHALKNSIFQNYEKLVGENQNSSSENKIELENRLNGLIKEVVTVMVSSVAEKEFTSQYMEEVYLGDRDQINNFKHVLSNDWREASLMVASQVQQWFKENPNDRQKFFLQRFSVLKESLPKEGQDLFDKKLQEIYDSKGKAGFDDLINQLVTISSSQALVGGKEDKVVNTLKEYPNIKSPLATGYGLLLPYIMKEDWKTIGTMMENGVEITSKEIQLVDLTGGNKEKNAVLQKIAEKEQENFGRVIKAKMLDFAEQPTATEEAFKKQFGSLKEMMPAVEQRNFDKGVRDIFTSKELIKRGSEFEDLEKESGIKGLINKLVVFCLKIIGKMEAKEKGFLADYEEIIVKGNKDQSARRTRMLSEEVTTNVARVGAKKEGAYTVTDVEALPSKPETSPSNSSSKGSGKEK
jgi:hypothetical protein